MSKENLHTPVKTNVEFLSILQIQNFHELHKVMFSLLSTEKVTNTISHK